MNTTARSIFVLTLALGLVAAAAVSVATASSATPLAVGALAVVSIMALLVRSYKPRPMLRRRAAPVAARPHRMPTIVRVPAMVEYPVRRVRARAA